jgi:hypothetical protein
VYFNIEIIPKKAIGILPFLNIGIIWLIVYLCPFLFASGLSLGDFFHGATIADTKEYEDYMYALENYNSLSHEKKVELVKSFYEKNSDDYLLGIQVSYFFPSEAENFRCTT